MDDWDLRHNYYALALCILTDSTIDEALRVQGVAPDTGWKKRSERGKSGEIKTLVSVLIFACGFNKTEVAKMLSVHSQTITEALVKAGAPLLDYRIRENTRRKKNG